MKKLLYQKFRIYIYSFRIKLKISNYYLIARQRCMLIKRYPRLSHSYIYISQEQHYPARYFTDHKDKRLAGEKRGLLGERNINQAWVISVSESRVRPASGQQQEHGSLRSVRRKRIELPVAILVEFGIDIRLLEIMRGR